MLISNITTYRLKTYAKRKKYRVINVLQEKYVQLNKNVRKMTVYNKCTRSIPVKLLDKTGFKTEF